MKFDSRLPIVLAGILMIAFGADLVKGCKPANHDQSIRDSLISVAVIARADAESTKSQARQQFTSDSIRWRQFTFEEIAKARTSIQDSSQRAMNRAVARARQQVRDTYGDSTNMLSSRSDDTICRVWSTCVDESIRQSGDSLLRMRLDSSRFASEVQVKSCSAAVSEVRLKGFPPTSSKEKSSWVGLFWSFLSGLLGFFGGLAL